MSNVMTETRNENEIYVDAHLVDDLLQVRVYPDNRKNPNRDESGIWVVLGNVEGSSKVLARGTKNYCDIYVKTSRQRYAINYGRELRGRIRNLLIDAEAKVKECSPEKTLAQQQALVKDVHSLTREAMLLASWFNDWTYTSDVNSDASDIRKCINLTYCGQELWNIKIHAATEEQALNMLKNAASISVVEVEGEGKASKFITHKVMCDGNVIAEGRERACQIFLAVSGEVIAELREAEEETRAQAQWEAERKAAEPVLSGELDAIEGRLVNGEHFAGEIQKLTMEILATANKYGLPEIVSRVREILEGAVLRIGEPLPMDVFVAVA